MKLLNLSWLLIPYAIILAVTLVNTGDWGSLLLSWEGIFLILSFVVLAGVSIHRTWVFHFNENGK